MHELARLIRKERMNRGASDFDVAEAEIVIDESGKAIDVIKRERGEGENRGFYYHSSMVNTHLTSNGAS